MGQGKWPKETVRAEERRCKLDAPFGVANGVGAGSSPVKPGRHCRPATEAGNPNLSVDRERRPSWEPCAVKAARTVLRGGTRRKAPTYPTRRHSVVRIVREDNVPHLRPEPGVT